MKKLILFIMFFAFIIPINLLCSYNSTENNNNIITNNNENLNLRLKKITINNSNGVIKTITYSYNKNNALQNITKVTSNDSFYEKIDYKYNSKNLLINETKKMKDSGYFYLIETNYEYNKENTLIIKNVSFKTYDDDSYTGTPFIINTKITYEYDKNKKLISEEIDNHYIYQDGDDSISNQEFITYEYNKEGLLISKVKTKDNPSSKYKEITTYEYNSKKLLISEHYVEPFGGYNILYEYNDENLLIKKDYKSNFEMGIKESTTTYQYDYKYLLIREYEIIEHYLGDIKTSDETQETIYEYESF